MKDHPFADGRSRIDGDIGMKDRVFTNGGLFADADAWVEGDPVPDGAAVSDVDKRKNREVLAQLGRRTHKGPRIDPSGLVRFLGIEGQDLAKAR